MSINSDLQKSIDKGTVGVLAGRAAHDPAVIAEFERFSSTGMTSATAAERDRHWAAEAAADAEAEAMSAFTSGDPPHGSGLVGWKKWCEALRDELDAFESARSRIEKHTDAPARTAASIRAAIKSGAVRLLAQFGVVTDSAPTDSPEVPVEQLQAQLAAEENAAAQSVQALAILDERIAAKRKALKAVEARANEFVRPYLNDIAARYAQLYVKRVEDLKEISSRLFAVEQMLGGYGTDWRRLERIALPKPPNCKLPDRAFDLKVEDADRDWWKSTRATLLKDPMANIKLEINN